MTERERYLTTAKQPLLRFRIQIYALGLCALIRMFSVSVVLADDSVRRLIFEDCGAASSLFSKLPQDQQSSLIDFLARIIPLNTQSPTAPEVFAVAPGAQLTSDPKGIAPSLTTDLVPGSLWQSTDAKRELHAKRCALRILKGAGALSLPAIPTLVSTYTDQSLSDEIAVSLEEVTGEIAEACHLSNTTPTQGVLQGLVENALGAHPLLARNILFEFRDAALTPLITTLATRPEAQTSDFISFIRGTYRSYNRSLFGEVLARRDNFTPEQLNILVRSLELPANEVLLELIPELIKLSLDIRLTGIITPFLGEACIRLGGLTLDPGKQSSIAEIPSIIDDDAVLTPAQVKCLIGSSAPLSKKVLELLKSQEILKLKRALELATAGLNIASPETRSAVYSFLAGQLAEPSSPLWEESLELILHFPEHKSDTISIIQQVLKSTLKSAKGAEQTGRLNGLFKLLDKLKLKGDLNRLSAQIADALLLDEPPVHAMPLARGLNKLDQRVTSRAFTAPPSTRSITALRVVIEREEVTTKNANSLIELLKYRDSQLLAERGLITLETKSATPLRKAMPRLAQYGGAKLYALSVLRALKVISPQEQSEFDSQLADLNDCSFLRDHEEVLCSGTSSPAVDTLSKQMLRCANNFSSESLQSVTECNPSLAQNLLKLADSAIDTTNIDSGRLLTISKAILKSSSQDHSQIAPTLARLLTQGDSATKLELLKALIPLKEVAVESEVLSALNQLASEALDKGDLSHLSIMALGQTKYKDFPWRDYVKRAIESAGQGMLTDDIALNIVNVPENEVLSEVLPALDSKKNERVVGAALVGAALRAKAIPIVSKLWQLRSEVTPAIRYTASLALLQINPLTPDLDETIGLLLLNRFYQRASMMPISWRNTVAVNDLNRSSFGTLRIERLRELSEDRRRF